MDKNKIIDAVYNKLKIKTLLPPDIKSQLIALANDLKKANAKDVPLKLIKFRASTRITDEQFGEVMNILIDKEVFKNERGERDADKVKELKKITDYPPVNTYFDKMY